MHNEQHVFSNVCERCGKCVVCVRVWCTKYVGARVYARVCVVFVPCMSVHFCMGDCDVCMPAGMCGAAIHTVAKVKMAGS